MVLTTPTADLRLVYSYDDARGVTVVDLALTPGGDLALVAGSDRLAQDVTRWLLTPQGADPTDPTYGNPLYSLVGRPAGPDPAGTLQQMVTQAEGAFLSRQQQEAALGYLALDQQVDHFTDVQVDAVLPSGNTATVSAGVGSVPVVPAAYRLSFTIVTRAGTQVPVATTLPV